MAVSGACSASRRSRLGGRPRPRCKGAVSGLRVGARDGKLTSGSHRVSDIERAAGGDVAGKGSAIAEHRAPIKGECTSTGYGHGSVVCGCTCGLRVVVGAPNRERCTCGNLHGPGVAEIAGSREVPGTGQCEATRRGVGGEVRQAVRSPGLVNDIGSRAAQSDIRRVSHDVSTLELQRSGEVVAAARQGGAGKVAEVAVDVKFAACADRQDTVVGEFRQW